MHWAICTGVFGKRDIGRIEREFLDVLDFELNITEDDVMAHHDTIMSLVSPTRYHSHTIPNAPLPQLSYPSGSPSSSEASFSPPTPCAVHEVSMAVDDRSKAEQHGLQLYQETYPVAPVPAHVPQPRHEKRHSHSSTFRIFRSLPFPRAFSHSSSSSSSSNNELQLRASSQNVAQPGRCQLLPPFAAQPTTQVYA